MTTGPGGHDSETMPGPSSGRPSTNDTTDDASPDRIRFTRRRVLVGLTATTVASVGTGVGLAALDNWGQWSRAEESTEFGVMATSIGGPNVRASPPLVVSRLAPGASQRRRVRVVVGDEPTGLLVLQFRRLEPDAETVDARPNAELAERLEISVGIDGETLREGTFRTIFDGSSVGIDRQTHSGTTFQLFLNWRLPNGVTARDVHSVVASALRFRSGTDANSRSVTHRTRA